MNKHSTHTGFSGIHIERLREKLSEWGNPSDSGAGNEGFIDLWFVDADVFHIYINSLPTGYLSSWPSLYALCPQDKVSQSNALINETDKELIDSIAIAVSYFIFGRFRETLSVQSRRFLITPEHERELDAMTIAVSFEAQENIPNQMTALTAHYLALSKTEDINELTKHIDNIFSLLRSSSPSGKVSRTLDLRQHLLSSMQDTAFFPSEDNPHTAFAFRSVGRAFDIRVKELAHEAFEIFLNSLIQSNSSIEKYASIKRTVFSFHSPTLRLQEYVNHVLKSYESLVIDDSVDDQRKKFSDNILTIQAKQSARQVSDIYAFSRLITLAEFLNKNYQQDDREWRINLLTGSHMQHTLREQWIKQNKSVRQVRLVHPLSVMGIDGFAQPNESLMGQDTEEQYEASGAYALRALKQDISGEINIDEFLRDFKSLLSSASVSYAPNRERRMRSLRVRLGGLDQHSRSVYLKSVRDAISREFISTLAQLNLISPDRKGKLPAVSLPTLSLPLDSSDPSIAERFVMSLHSTPPPTPIPAPPVAELIKADPTGYSALLCAGLGYLAQGQSWLRLAEGVASTAIAFVSTQLNENPENNEYPKGNEALYFAAFVSRMQVDGSAVIRSHAVDWLDRHQNLLNRALEILDEWKETEIGQRCVADALSEKTTGKTLAQLVRVRYETEQFAANVFGHLIDRLDMADPKLMIEPPIKNMDTAKVLSEQWSALSKLKLKPQYRADVAFVGAQLTASIIQLWLCIRADDNGVSSADNPIKVHEKWITGLITTQTKTNPAPGSALVKVLVEIFNSRTQGEKLQKRNLREAERYLSMMQFASLDVLRVPLFKRLLAQPEAPIALIFRT